MAGYPVYNSFRANTKEGSGYDPYEDMQEVYNPTLPTVIGDPTATGDGRYYGDGTPGSSNSNSGSSYNLPSFDDIVGSLTKQFGQGLTNPQLIPGLASAYQYYQNADKYGDMGSQLSKDANPFGDRSKYVQGLSDLYTDPSSIENSAAYKFRMSEGLNTLGPQLAAKGGGYGNATGSMMKYASDLASQEYDKEWQRRYEAAGGKFDPANAGRLQLDAARLESDAKNAALGQMMAPFAPQPTTTINNNGGGTSGGSTTGGFKPSDVVNGVLKTGAGLQQTVSAIYGGGQGALNAISQAMASGAKFIDLGNGTMIDLEAAARSMGGTDSPGNFGTYPTDGSIGNYGPIEPIVTGPEPYTPIINYTPIVDQTETWYDVGNAPSGDN
jgi:hypothetical protein